MESCSKDVIKLSALAEEYRIRGSDNPQLLWADILKAHTLYNACDHRIPDTRMSHAAYEIQQLYWNGRAAISFEDQTKLTQNLKRQLRSIRNLCDSEISLLTSCIESWDSSTAMTSNDDPYNKFCTDSKIISLVCNARMKVFAGGLIQKAVEICQIKCPCNFAAVAMGSLAKGEATPYSDLEFLFLVDTKTDKIIQYFELLAMTVYFLIGNLQETKLKYMNIEELKHFDDRCTNRFKIDGLQQKAGNIPTGNGTLEQKNKFILTVDELVAKYRTVWENPDPVESLKGDLTSMLTQTNTLYGDPSLLTRFEEQRLKMTENNARSDIHQAMLQQDLVDYNFMPSEDLRASHYKANLKSAIYRYPSILLCNLKVVYNIDSKNAWETLDRLLEANRLSDSFYDSLKFLLATAQYIRLAAYSYHGSQNESITFLQQVSLTGQRDKQCHRSRFWHIPKQLAFNMSLHITAVKETLNGRVVTDSILTTLMSRIQTDEQLATAILHYQLQNFQEAIKILENRPYDTYTLEMKCMLVYCYSDYCLYGDNVGKIINDIIKEYTERQTLLQPNHNNQTLILHWKYQLAQFLEMQRKLEDAWEIYRLLLTADTGGIDLSIYLNAALLLPTHGVRNDGKALFTTIHKCHERDTNK